MKAQRRCVLVSLALLSAFILGQQGGSKVAYALTPLTEIVSIARTPSGEGYWLMNGAGQVSSFGRARRLGSFTASTSLYTSMTPTPSGKGLWAVTEAGEVSRLGDARNLGNFEAGDEDCEPFCGGCESGCEGLLATPSGKGLWGFSSDGAVFRLGDAPDLGNFPSGIYVDYARTPNGKGLWGLSSVGHVISLGDARVLGNFVADDDCEPFCGGCESGCGLIATPSGKGLWGFSAEGVVVRLGDAPDLGNFVSGSGYVDGVATPTGTGLWGVTIEGRVSTVGDAIFAGDLTGQSVALTVTKSGDGTGAVNSNPAGITCGTACAASYTPGTVVTLTANADSGSVLSQWGGDCSGSGSCTLTMDASKSVTAIFSRLFTLTVTNVQFAGTGTVTSNPSGIDCGSTCSAVYVSGAVVTLTATPDSGAIFAGWSGACSGTDPTCTVTLDANRSVTATFDAFT